MSVQNRFKHVSLKFVKDDMIDQISRRSGSDGLGFSLEATALYHVGAGRQTM